MYPQYYLNSLEKALKKSELYDFLIGKEEYFTSNPYANTPTDPILVMQTIKLHTQNSERIIDLLVPVVEKMSMDPNYSWFSLYYLIDLIDLAKECSVDLTDIVKHIQNNLSANKNILTKDKRWMGASWPDGLWGDVKRMARNIETNYGVIIIPPTSPE